MMMMMMMMMMRMLVEIVWRIKAGGRHIESTSAGRRHLKLYPICHKAEKTRSAIQCNLYLCICTCILNTKKEEKYQISPGSSGKGGPNEEIIK